MLPPTIHEVPLFDFSKPFRAVACEGFSLRFSCKTRMIKIDSAVYGRSLPDAEQCPSIQYIKISNISCHNRELDLKHLHVYRHHTTATTWRARKTWAMTSLWGSAGEREIARLRSTAELLVTHAPERTSTWRSSTNASTKCERRPQKSLNWNNWISTVCNFCTCKLLLRKINCTYVGEFWKYTHRKFISREWHSNHVYPEVLPVKYLNFIYSTAALSS